MEKYALDTDILIDFLRGKNKAVSVIKKLKEEGFLATTVINIFELFWGAYKLGKKKRIDAVRRLTERLEILFFNEKIAESAGKEIAHLESIGLPINIRDLLIGTIAREHGYIIVTSDEKHFQRIRELEVVNWRKMAT